MRGSGGGGFHGGGFIYSGGPGSDAQAIALGLLLLAGGVACGVYKVADTMDKPDRVPYTTSLIAASAEQCFNGASQAGDLKDKLGTAWASTHETFRTTYGNVVLCQDPAASSFVLKDEFVDEKDTRHDWEFRIAAIHYTRPGGEQAMVVTTSPGRRALNSTDVAPDSMMTMNSIMHSMNTKSHTENMLLKDGTIVSVLLQRDGVYETKYSNRTYDEDGTVWATQDQMKDMAKFYTFRWPLNGGPRVVAGADMAPSH